MWHRAPLLLGLILSGGLASGCATIPRHAGFPEVAKTVESRTGVHLQRYAGATTGVVADTIQELLREAFTVDRAVRMALLNNRGLQATLEEGPFGPIGMGGMFTLLKVHEDVPSFATAAEYTAQVQFPDDLGWYDHPTGMVAESIHKDGNVPGTASSVEEGGGERPSDSQESMGSQGHHEGMSHH